MRINQPSQVRNAWYDRAPSSEAIEYDAAIAPAAAALRATYTCPAGVYALVGLLAASVAQVTNQSGVGNARCWIAFTPNGGAEVVILQAQAHMNNNYNEGSEQAGEGGFVMVAGDTLKIYTESIATGGTVRYHGGAIVTEFTT